MKGWVPTLPKEPQFIDVTPEMARYWLEHKAPNRDISRNAVARYLRDMRAGMWTLTHQGIAFDNEGRLVDGQTRLTAIAQLGKPIKCLIVPGLHKDAIRDIDQHRKRDAADAITIAGGTASKDQCSIAKAMHSKAMGGRSDLSVGMLGEFIDKHRHAIEFALQVRTKGPRGVGQAHVAAAIAVAWYWVDQSRLLAFCHVLINGMPGEPPDQDVAAVLLRNFLIAGRPTGNASASGLRRESYLRVQRAVERFCARKPIGKLYAASADIYLLPEDAEKAGIP